MAIMRKDAVEDFGEVYGFSLVYSGNFKMLLEAETYGTMRFQAGVNPHNFKWKLNKGRTIYYAGVGNGIFKERIGRNVAYIS